MDLHQSIDINKTALARIVAGLYALLGLTGDAVLARIPRGLYRTIARVLKPAESAVRRLIVLMAMTIRVKEKASPPHSRPAPTGIVRAKKGKPGLSFQLFDQRQQFLPQTHLQDAAAGPRIISFENGAVRANSAGRGQTSTGDGLEDSANLVRRLQSLKAALDDLPRQAKRLIRARARREKVPHLRFQGPLRPGHAPGWRRRPREEIDHLLRECDWLAREALPPDTS